MDKSKCIIINLLIILSFSNGYGTNCEIIDFQEGEKKLTEKAISEYTPSKTCQGKNVKNTPKVIESPPTINQSLLISYKFKPPKILGQIKKQNQNLDFPSPTLLKQSEFKVPRILRQLKIPSQYNNEDLLDSFFKKNVDLELSLDDEDPLFRSSVIKHNIDDQTVQSIYSTQSEMPINVNSVRNSYTTNNSKDFQVMYWSNCLKEKINSSLKVCKSLNKKIKCLEAKNEVIEKNLVKLSSNNNKLKKMVSK